MKQKTKTILLSLMVITIFSNSSSVSGWLVGLSSIDYPLTIVEGESFTVTPYFTYNTAEDGCLGRWKPVYLFYSINSPIILLSNDGSAGDYFTEEYEGTVYNSEDYRPESVTFTIDSDDLGLVVNDIFRFQIRYWQAFYLYSDGEYYPATGPGSMLTSPIKEITVVEGELPTDNTTDLISFYLLLPLLALAVITVTTKKRRK